MTVTTEQVLAQLKRVKGPDLDGNIVDLGLVSPIVLKGGRASFSITVPAARAEELEPLREAAESVVRDMPGIEGVTVVLTADAAPGGAGRGRGGAQVPESARVQAARATAGGAPGHHHGHDHSHPHSHGPAPAAKTAAAPGAAAAGARNLMPASSI